MKIDLVVADPLRHKTPVLVIGCCEDARDELLASCDKLLDGYLERLLSAKEFTAKQGTTRLVPSFGKLAAERVLLVGLGKRGELNSERLRQGAGYAIQALRGARLPSFASALHLAAGDQSALEAVCVGSLLASYSFDHYKTKDREERFAFETMEILFPKGAAAAGARDTIEGALAVYQGVHLARDLVSHPGNVVATGYLAEVAHDLAARRALSCLVLDADYLNKLEMNALLAVGKGSAEPPRLIVLEYQGAGDRGRATALVGKGITFDSGGISLKPREGMEGMKTDMAGAAAVMGTMEAAALLKLPVNLVGIIPTAENMPGSRAYKPGDVITAMSGTTIEITNTDAEGRLVLCDALHYARTHYKPGVMIDLATLTGACVIALAHEACGLMGNDRRLLDDLKRSAERTGERAWEMPVWDDYGDIMKSDIADIKNSGGRYGGAITAAWFLKQFVAETRWAHLDIAGTAWLDKGGPYIPKGATGFGVRLLIDYLRGKQS